MPTIRSLTVATALALGLALVPTIAVAAPGDVTAPTVPPPPTGPGQLVAPTVPPLPTGPTRLTIPRPTLSVELDSAAEDDGVADGRIVLSAPIEVDLDATVQVLFPSASPWDIGCPTIGGGGACPWTIDLEVPAGATEVPFDLSLVDGDGPEDTEVLRVAVTSTHPANRLNVGPAADAFLFDGSGLELELADAEGWEGGVGGQRHLDFVVSASAASPVPISFSFRTAIVGESAEVGLDYTAVDVIGELPAGATEVTVEVPIIGDAIDEEDELLFGHLADLSLGEVALSGDVAIGRILDDDGPGEGPGPVGRGPGDFTTRPASPPLGLAPR